MKRFIKNIIPARRLHLVPYLGCVAEIPFMRITAITIDTTQGTQNNDVFISHSIFHVLLFLLFVEYLPIISHPI